MDKKSRREGDKDRRPGGHRHDRDGGGIAGSGLAHGGQCRGAGRGAIAADQRGWAAGADGRKIEWSLYGRPHGRRGQGINKMTRNHLEGYGLL